MTPIPDIAPHESVLDRQLTLSLNRHWAVIGTLTVRKALINLASESGGQHPAFAMDITMATDENGDDVLVSAVPLSWEQWLEVDVRPGDLYIQTHKQRIRVPTVVVAAHYDKTPFKKPRLSAAAIWERDQGTCQYTGKKLTRATGNVDHVIPRDRGGKDEWINLALADRQVNTRKGNRLNSEVGLTLIRAPKAPPAIPIAATITEARHPTWTPFLLK